MKRYPIDQFQIEAVDEILRNLETNPKQILAWYTGSGKTNIFLEVARKLLRKNPKIKIGISAYLHTNIKSQTSKRAEQFLDHHEVINAGVQSDGRYGVYIFNPQVLYKREALVFAVLKHIIENQEDEIRERGDRLSEVREVVLMEYDFVKSLSPIGSQIGAPLFPKNLDVSYQIILSYGFIGNIPKAEIRKLLSNTYN